MFLAPSKALQASAITKGAPAPALFHLFAVHQDTPGTEAQTIPELLEHHLRIFFFTSYSPMCVCSKG